MLGVGGAWHLGRLQIELGRSCQRESSSRHLSKRGMEWSVLAQRNDEALGVLNAIESGKWLSVWHLIMNKTTYKTKP